MNEAALAKTVALLWDELPPVTRKRLIPVIEQLGTTAALPAGALAPTWKSTIELALEFGLAPSTIRTNWPRLYGIRPTGDKWLAADVERVRVTRRLRGTRCATTNV